MAVFPFSESIYAFITWLCSVKRHPWWQTSSVCSVLLACGLHMHPFLLDTFHSGGSCRSSGSRFPWVARVQNNVKCSRSVEQTYIILTASDFSWQNTCTKGGSFSWRRIESASKLDPGWIGSASESNLTDWYTLVNLCIYNAYIRFITSCIITPPILTIWPWCSAAESGMFVYKYNGLD